MNTKQFLFYSLLVVFTSGISCAITEPMIPDDISPNKVVPSERLIDYQKMELIGFIHFTINTFTDKEWGYGDESPALFNPTALDVEQWVSTAKTAGMKELILTAKHHDGFCLWPSKYTDHDIANSPYKDGQGDIVKEFVEACRKHGLKAGLYLSPWDRNHAEYGRIEYIRYYKNQLKELLTEYGEINEIWFDGANGGDGYYGGANEARHIDRATYYQWDSMFAYVKTLQPDVKIFSDAGPDVHWIGNEHGFAGSTFWSMMNRDSVGVGTSKTDYLNTGDPVGMDWVVGQCDVSIRPGWFYHESQDSMVKSLQELLDIYYKSVGRNAILLLNLPPDRRGLIPEKDVKSLGEFRRVLDETFGLDLAKETAVIASNYRLSHDKFSPQNVVDNNEENYWAVDDTVCMADITLSFPDVVTFDRICLQEPIRFGQRISQFEIDVFENGGWKTVFEGTTIGYKRLIRIPLKKSEKLRIKILEANNTIALSNVAVYKSSVYEK